MRGYKIALPLILILSPVPVVEAGNTTAAFLKIGVGARPVGMGNAFTAVANDVNALVWNPAGLCQLSMKEMTATHTELFVDTRYDFIGYAQPAKTGVLGFGVNYLSQGKIESRSADRQVTGGFDASDMAVNLAYSRFVAPEVGLGVNFKYLKSQIADVSAQGWAVDLGGLYKTPIRGLGLGLAVQNLGPGLKFLEERSSLPLSFTAGAGYRLPGMGMLLALDVKYMLYDKKTSVSVGTEYSVFSFVTLRAGYLAALTGGTGAGDFKRASNSMGAGFGLKLRGIGADYAFTPFGELGNTQRFSLSMRF